MPFPKRSGFAISLKHLISVLFLLTAHCSPLTIFSQDFPPVKNDAFSAGEKFSFTVFYDSYLTGKVMAGVATLQVNFERKKIEGREVYHVVGEGKSKGAFNVFFKVNDRFESFIDTEYLIPWYFVRRTREGNYKKDDEVQFNQYSGTASSRTMNRAIPKGTHDVLSAFFYARTVDISGLKPGEYLPLSFFLDDSVYLSRVIFVGREVVKTEAGTFRCLRFKPLVATGGVFSQPYPMDVWVTDDRYRIPILAKSAVIVGSVKMELASYQGIPAVLPSKVE
jgi:hypothetical protein